MPMGPLLLRPPSGTKFCRAEALMQMLAEASRQHKWLRLTIEMQLGEVSYGELLHICPPPSSHRARSQDVKSSYFSRETGLSVNLFIVEMSMNRMELIMPSTHDTLSSFVLYFILLHFISILYNPMYLFLHRFPI